MDGVRPIPVLHRPAIVAGALADVSTFRKQSPTLARESAGVAVS